RSEQRLERQRHQQSDGRDLSRHFPGRRLFVAVPDRTPQPTDGSSPAQSGRSPQPHVFGITAQRRSSSCIIRLHRGWCSLFFVPRWAPSMDLFFEKVLKKHYNRQKAATRRKKEEASCCI